MLRDVNERHAALRPGDADLRARIATFDVARGMMREAPEALDIGREIEGDARLVRNRRRRHDLVRLAVPDRPPADRARRARRRADRHRLEQQLGRPRQHAGPPAQGPARRPGDRRPCSKTSKQRGLLDQTLVAICTEFGRTPWTDAPGTKGRNHYAKAFTSLAGRRAASRGDCASARPTSTASTSSPTRARPRLPRHDPAPDGHRPHAAHLPLRRPRLPPDRRRRQCGHAGTELT